MHFYVFKMAMAIAFLRENAVEAIQFKIIEIVFFQIRGVKNQNLFLQI